LYLAGLRPVDPARETIMTYECTTIETILDHPDPAPDFWKLSATELARSCRLVAESNSGPQNGLVRAEALRLFLLWREAITAHSRKSDNREEEIALLWGLRKRTIQILVRLSRQGLLFIP
jgi:hypothetical protein